MKYKPEAILYEDVNGVFTLYCKTKEVAQKIMQETINENEIEGIVIDLDDIKEATMYKGHRKCGGYNIGDNVCWECGEDMNHRPIKTFIYNF